MGCRNGRHLPMNKQYYVDLVNRVFNVLYTYEQKPDDFKDYTDSIVFELSGNDEIPDIQQIRFRLNALLSNEINHSIVRRTVLKSISILDKILSNWKE